MFFKALNIYKFSKLSTFNIGYLSFLPFLSVCFIPLLNVCKVTKPKQLITPVKIHPSIFYTRLIQLRAGVGGYPSCHWVRGREHPGQVQSYRVYKVGILYLKVAIYSVYTLYVARDKQPSTFTLTLGTI